MTTKKLKDIGVKLLPCPFCRGEGTMDLMLRNGYEQYQDDPDAWAHFVRCLSCAATGGWAKSVSGGIRNWNMRALPLPCPERNNQPHEFFLDKEIMESTCVHCGVKE